MHFHSLNRRIACVSLAAATVVLAACAPVTATPEALPSPEPIATRVPESQPVVQVPPPTATIEPTPTALLSTTSPEPTAPPPATATVTPESSPTATAEPLDGRGVLSGQYVPMPLIGADASSGFTDTQIVSYPTVVISNGVTITSFGYITVSGAVPPPVAPVALPEGTINIALLGVDTRPREGGLNTDVIIIASVHPTLPVVTLFSIPRDTLVYIPNQRMHKVNTAFRYGGDEYGPMLFKQTIKYNFGINVDYYAMVNFSGVVGAVSSLGGIEVVATCPLYQVFPRDPYYYADEANPTIVSRPYTDTFTGEVWQPGTLVPTQTIWIPRAGVYQLNGMQALAFARARYGVPGGDLDRGRRAQRVIRAVLSKARQTGSITQIPALYAQFERNLRTDLVLTDLLSLATQVERIDEFAFRNRFLDGVGMTPVTLPVVGSVLIPNRANMTGYVQRALFVNENVRANESVPVEFWNGTTREDFAVAATDRLRELGFAVVDVQQVEALSKTQIIDFTSTSKGSALPLLQRSFGISDKQITAQPQELPNVARYRIIASDDFDPCYFQGRASTGASPAVRTPTPAAPDAGAPVNIETPIAPAPEPPAPQPPPEAPPAPPQAATAAP